MRSAIPIFIACAAMLTAQEPATPTTFDAASLKPSAERGALGWTGGPGTKDPGRYTYGRATPLALILTAYHVDLFQISSKFPLDQQHFDVDAKVAAGATKEQFRVMLQNLLAERFHLKVHLESKEFPAYELVVSKTGLKLGAAPPSDERFPTLPANTPGLQSRMATIGGAIVTRMRGQQEPISELAHFIRLPDNAPVVDKTGLTGKYDFTLEFAYDLPASASGAAEPSTVPDIYHALQQQLGLQLVPKKLPFPVVVVDSIDKTPTGN